MYMYMFPLGDRVVISDVLMPHAMPKHSNPRIIVEEDLDSLDPLHCRWM